MDRTHQILKEHQLRITDCRREVLSYFLANQYAINHSELELELSDFDRVTIYRTLNTFLEKGIIHKVIDGSGAIKYAQCSDGCSDRQHLDEHVHFTCVKCGQTQCIDSIHIPPIQLPAGFRPVESSYLVQGLCNNC